MFHVQRSHWRRLVAACIGLATLLASLGPPVAARSATNPAVTSSFAPGVILVAPRPGVSAQQLAGLTGESAPATPPDHLGVELLPVAPGHEYATVARLRRSGLVAAASPDYLRHTAAFPDDPDYPAQWALPRIDAPDAWASTLGDPSITVAVIDTGEDFEHPDRPIHLIAGPTYTSVAARDGCATDTSATPEDDLGHGTHVAGIIAAATDNGIGVAGLAPEATVLVIKAGDCTGTLADSDIIQAINYATDAGARVVNMSFGGPEPDPVLNQAIQAAWSRGVVLVAAAGNQGSEAPFYPAALPHVVGVAATNERDARASFSNYGPDAIVAAPGVAILSTVPPFVSESGYAYESGTSMASPLVAATAALVLAEHPGFTGAQVVQAIEQGADGSGGCQTTAGAISRVDAAGALASARALASANRVATAWAPYHVFLPLVLDRCGA